MLVCAIGDLLLDVVVRLEGPIAPDTDTFGRTLVGPGGQAANVAAWVTALGARGRALAKRAGDPAGRVVAAELRARGVEVVGPEADAGTGTVVSIATPDGARTMLSDRGVSRELETAELDPGWIEDADWLYVSGYSLVATPLAETATAAARIAAHVALDVASTAAVGAVGAEVFGARARALAPELIFTTAAEEAVTGPLEARTVVVKRGGDGAVVRSGGREHAYDAHPADVVDTTGAGDAFAAGYLVGGPELALDAAARCVGRMGAMP
jgi:ribokinase